VRVSNARTTPLGTSTRSLSEILEPTITKSSMIAGGEVSSYSPSRRMFLIPWRRLIWPAVPKSPHGLPVAASKQIKRASMVAINMRRLDRLVGLLSGPVVENVIELPQKNPGRGCRRSFFLPGALPEAPAHSRNPQLGDPSELPQSGSREPCDLRPESPNAWSAGRPLRAARPGQDEPA